MMKAIVLLALSLTALASVAAYQGVNYQGVNYGGYRIGNSDVMLDSVRVFKSDDNELSSDDFVTVTDHITDDGLSLVASRINGQKIVRWWSYNYATSTPPEYNGVVTNATDTYAVNWKYGTVSYMWARVVVDYDYIKYNLSYNANGGSGALPSTADYIIYTNEVVIANNNLTRTGYTWSGWTNDLTTTVWTNGETVTGSSLGLNSIVDGSNVVLRAKWTANDYTVTFDPCGGSVVPESTNVTYDAAWPILPTPTRPDYRFDGWYKADGSSIVTTGAVKLTEDLALSARWTRLFTATFVDEIGHETNSVVVASNTVPVTSWQPYHEGFKFNGWNPETNRLDRSMTFTALFSGVDYIVRLHANFGSPEATENMTFSYGTAKILVVNAFERLGYEFKGWSDSQDGNAKYCKNGTEESVLNPAEDLYAVWKPIEYSISFDANGGEGEMEDVSVEYGEVYTVTNCTFTKTGVSFVGWTTNIANGVEFYVDDGVSNLTTTAGAAVMFYAVWSEPRYIAFVGNGANDASAMADDVMTFEGAQTKTLVSNKFERTGYTFAGWATNEATAAALDVTYTNCAEVVSTNLWMAIGETNVFHAVWQTNKYTVVFHANGGTGSMDPMMIYYDQEASLSAVAFSYPNVSLWAFDCWSNDVDGVAFSYTNRAVVLNLATENGAIVDLYAIWRSKLSDLSKAMHCSNLVWESTFDEFDKEKPQWEIAEGAGEGYNLSGSSVSNQVDYNQQSQTLRPIGSSGSGKLSFMYKMAGDSSNSWLTFISSDTIRDGVEVDWRADWKEYGPIDVSDISTVQIFFYGNEDADPSTVWIDQMTWEPDSVEPTDEDKPMISGFAKTADGFTLLVDQANISDSFSYQILATNELVNGDWPVKETLTAGALKAGYEIVIEENEPKMFYKVKVISK